MSKAEKNNWLTEEIVIAIVKQTIRDRNPSEAMIYDSEEKGFLSEDRTFSIYPKGTPIPDWTGEKNAEECTHYSFSIDKINRALRFLRESIVVVKAIPFTPLVIEDDLFQIRIAPMLGD